MPNVRANSVAGMSDDERVFDDDEKQRAWLAGLARVLANPAMLRDLRRATLLRGQRNFDKFCREAKFELPEAADTSHQ